MKLITLTTVTLILLCLASVPNGVLASIIEGSSTSTTEASSTSTTEASSTSTTETSSTSTTEASSTSTTETSSTSTTEAPSTSTTEASSTSTTETPSTSTTTASPTCTPAPTTKKPIECGHTGIPTDCVACNPTCKNPHPKICPRPICRPGCNCKKGYFKDSKGNCVSILGCVIDNIHNKLSEWDPSTVSAQE